LKPSKKTRRQPKKKKTDLTVELPHGVLGVARVIELDEREPGGLARDPDVVDATEAAELGGVVWRVEERERRKVRA